jgi:regulator of protease activity HflC (stomatin/prohibitin superfamily)
MLASAFALAGGKNHYGGKCAYINGFRWTGLSFGRINRDHTHGGLLILRPPLLVVASRLRHRQRHQKTRARAMAASAKAPVTISMDASESAP